MGKGYQHILGPEAMGFHDVLRSVVPSLQGTQYEFLSEQAFGLLSPAAMSRVYWTEMLARAHWASASSLVRMLGWLDAVVAANRDRNLFAFSAGCRGLIEAASDSATALSNVPLTLARDSAAISDAIREKAAVFVVNPEIEDQLIHFAYGRKLGKCEIAPTAHKAKTVAEYRASIEAVEPRVAESYALLCDITHPGALSVHLLLESDSGDPTIVRIATDAQPKAIRRVAEAVQPSLPWVLQLGINPALVTLAVLRRFPLMSLHTKIVDSLNLAAIPLWAKSDALFRSA